MHKGSVRSLPYHLPFTYRQMGIPSTIWTCAMKTQCWWTIVAVCRPQSFCYAVAQSLLSAPRRFFIALRGAQWQPNRQFILEACCNIYHNNLSARSKWNLSQPALTHSHLLGACIPLGHWSPATGHSYIIRGLRHAVLNQEELLHRMWQTGRE